MARQIACVVENARHLDHFAAAAVEQKTGRLLHLCAAYFGPAQGKLISARPFNYELGTLLRSWPLVVGFDINQSLPYEGLVAEGCVNPEFLRASFEYGGDIASGGGP